MVTYEATPPRDKIDLMLQSIATTNFKKNCEAMDKKSSQTSEMAVKLSKKRSKLALERAWGVKEDARLHRLVVNVQWYIASSLGTRLNGTVLCRLFDGQNVPKSCVLW